MGVETRTRFDVVPLGKHIGAEIRGLDLREKPDEEIIRAIYRAWLDHLVIVFPDQRLSQEDLIRVTGYFGELGELSPFLRVIPVCSPASCSSPTSARMGSRSAPCPTGR